MKFMGKPGGRQISEFEASLVYKVNSRTARVVTQRNPVLKREEKEEKVSRGVSN